jgi:hypothetical protein
MTEMKTDLTTVLPPGGGDKVSAGGEIIEIKPATLGQLAAAMKAGAGLLKTFKERDGEFDIVLVLAERSDELLNTAAALLDKPVEWIAALPADEAVDLAVKVVSANIDFFTRVLLPKINEAAGSISKAVQPAGQKPSNGSLRAGTH